MKPARKFWPRWCVDPLHRQLTQGVSPEKLALTLAVGGAFALFPVLGTTTMLCLLAGIFLSLNQPIIQGINALCFFVYFPALIGFIRLGDAVTGTPSAGVNLKPMVALFRQHPGEFFRRFGVTGLHAVLGWVLAAPLAAVLAYFVALIPLRAAARRLQHRA